MGAKISCEHKPPWYDQLLQMDEDKRIAAHKLALENLKKSKPDTYKFILENKLEFVGFMPNIEYTLPDDREKSLDITYIHDFSQYTLLYWCKQGRFALFVNASLKYNADGLRGFTY